MSSRLNRQHSRLFFRITIVVILLIFLGIVASLLRAKGALQHQPDLLTTAYVGSAACVDCHQDRHESWAKTFHATMTQDVSATNVQGQFDGQLLNGFGGLMRPLHDNRGYWFEFLDSAQQSLGRVQVTRMVGSNRYQQYLTKHTGSGADSASESYFRLHYLWHKNEQRWVHLNAAFLGSDKQDFDAQTTSWNGTCVFCHNTGPEPRLQNLVTLRNAATSGAAVDFKMDARYDTKVAELGISCESCHAPGAEHVQRMQQLNLRWGSKLLGVVDQSIVNPKRLAAARSNDVCGACHAQRTLKQASDIERWYSAGPTYRPGDQLTDHVTILSKATPSPDPRDPHLFANRFWADGAVRLTAYELQAQNASKCGQNSALTCLNCHTMHGGDPQGMLPKGADRGDAGDAPCLRCHQELKTQIAQHTQHPTNSEGARCMACHMPRQVFGVMEIHRTHQTQLPDVGADLAAGKPNACLNCHVEKTAAWAAETLSARWPKQQWSKLSTRLDQAPIDWADGLVALLAGDPVRQAIAADELGRIEQAQDAAKLALRLPWLLEAMQDDRPGVRRFAWRSARAIDAKLTLGMADTLAQFDYTGDPAARQIIITKSLQQFAALDKRAWSAPDQASGLDVNYQLRPEVRERLLALGAAEDKQIDIGE
jgi:hypothetical protein